jgi:uncharacterized protein (TIRG00374 family)
MRFTLKLLLFGGGLALFGWYVQRVGLAEIAKALRQLGWAAPLVLVPYGVVGVVDCLGWRWTLPAKLPLGFLALLRIRWAGEAVNNVVPSAYLGGEAVKVVLLGQRGIPAPVATSAAIVSKSAQTVAQIGFIALAALALLLIAPNQPGLKPALAVVVFGGSLTVALLFWLQRRGVFRSFLVVADRFGVAQEWLSGRRAGWLETDQIIATYYREHRGRMMASMLSYLGGWLLDSVEIYVVAHLLGQPINGLQAIAVEALTGVAKIAGMWVPGALGLQESGLLVAGRWAGLPGSFCLAYAVLRRGREAVFAGIGWLLLYAVRGGTRSDAAQAVGDGL